MVIRQVLDRFLTVCERTFVALANGCLAFMLLSNGVNILSRAVLNKGDLVGFPVDHGLVRMVGFSGLLYFLPAGGRSISVDLIVDRLSGCAKKVLQLFINAAVLIVLGVILYTVPDNLHEQVGVLEMVGLQRYTLSIPFFVSCGLVCLHVVSDSMKILHD